MRTVSITGTGSCNVVNDKNKVIYDIAYTETSFSEIHFFRIICHAIVDANWAADLPFPRR